MIIDAKDQILGRLGAYVAKRTLLGEEVTIVNCDQAIITGNKDRLLRDIKNASDRGTHKGPFIPKRSDYYVKRAIRGMLPHKQPKGRDAYKRIRCYVGVPEKMQGEKLTKPTDSDISRLANVKYIRIKEACRHLGGKL